MPISVGALPCKAKLMAILENQCIIWGGCHSRQSKKRDEKSYPWIRRAEMGGGPFHGS